MKQQVKEKDFTETFLSYIFPPKIITGRVDIISVSILGTPSCGKTTLMEWLGETADDVYGDLVNIIYANGFRVAAAHMDDRPVQLIFLDDVSGQASAFKGGNAEAIQINNTFRHKLEDCQEANGHRYYGGLVIIVKGWQRDNDLHRAFKQDDCRIYKTAPVLSDERDELAKEIGEHYVKKLEEITYKIRIMRDQKAKSDCVCVLSYIGKSAGVGVLHYEQSDYRFPRIKDEHEFVKGVEKEKKKAEKEEETKDPPTRTRARVCDEAVLALHREGRSVREIARLLNTTPSTVQRKVKACECTITNIDG